MEYGDAADDEAERGQGEGEEAKEEEETSLLRGAGGYGSVVRAQFLDVETPPAEPDMGSGPPHFRRVYELTPEQSHPHGSSHVLRPFGRVVLCPRVLPPGASDPAGIHYAFPLSYFATLITMSTVVVLQRLVFPSPLISALHAVCASSFFAAGSLNPGIVSPRTIQNQYRPSPPLVSYLPGSPPGISSWERPNPYTHKYCATCNVYRPPRSKHCGRSNRCIRGFDHYCPWVGNAVGGGNYVAFVVFLFAAWASAAVGAGGAAVKIGGDAVGGDGVEGKEVALAVVCVPLVVSLGALGVYHVKVRGGD